MKTIEWLRSQLEDGDVLTAEVIGEWLASFWHKSEMGQVDVGETKPVSGDAVATYVAAKLVEETLKPIVAGLLEVMLPPLLANYVNSETLAAALSGKATESWVQNLIAGKADTVDVNAALADKADVTALPDVSTMVTQSDLTTALAGKADATAVYTKTEADSLLNGKADTTAVYTKQQIDGLVASRPTEVEIAGTIAQDVNNLKTAVGDSNNGLLHDVAALSIKIGDNAQGIDKDLKENRTKTNEIITALKGGDTALATVTALTIEP